MKVTAITCGYKWMGYNVVVAIVPYVKDPAFPMDL